MNAPALTVRARIEALKCALKVAVATGDEREIVALLVELRGIHRRRIEVGP